MNLKPNIVFTSPVLNHPALGGPELRIENSIIALSKISNTHLLCQKSWMELHSLNWHDIPSNNYVFNFYSSLVRTVNFPSGKNKSFSILTSISNGSEVIVKWKRNFILLKLINLFFRYSAIIVLNLMPKVSLARDVVNLARKTNSQIIWFGYGNISYDLMLEVKRLNPSLKLVCDTDSVWSRFILRELPLEKNHTRKLEISENGKKKEKEEAHWVSFCDITTAVSIVDKSYYQNLTNTEDKIKLFSNVLNLESYKNDDFQKFNNNNFNIFLGGSFGEKSPMDQAARWFINEVFDQVVEKQPKVHLHIVGRQSDIILKDVDKSNITIHGTVESILPIIFQSSVAVVPLFFESGTRFKILESGACRVPVVSTSLGAEGLQIEDHKHLLIADNPLEFADCVLEILENPKLAKSLSEHLYKFVKESSSIDSLIKEGKEILASLT